MLASFCSNGRTMWIVDPHRDEGNAVVDIQNSGHAPTDPSESAIIAELPPGNYTAIVRGANNTTGVGLVEVYDLQ